MRDTLKVLLGEVREEKEERLVRAAVVRAFFKRELWPVINCKSRWYLMALDRGQR